MALSDEAIVETIIRQAKVVDVLVDQITRSEDRNEILYGAMLEASRVLGTLKSLVKDQAVWKLLFDSQYHDALVLAQVQGVK